MRLNLSELRIGIKDQLLVLLLRVLGAFVALMVLALSTRGMEDSEAKITLLILNSLAASNFLDLGILTQITSRFQAKFSSNHSSLEQVKGIRDLVLAYSRKFVFLSLVTSFVTCALVVIANPQLRESNLVLNAAFLTTLFLIYAITNYVNRAFIALGKVKLLLTLQALGASINLILVIVVIRYSGSFYLIVSSFLTPNIFVSVCALIGYRTIMKSEKSKLELVSLEIKPSIKGSGITLQLTQSIQFSLNLLVPFIVSSVFSHEIFVQFTYCSRIYGFLISTFGALVFVQLRRDTNSIFETRIPYNLVLISRNDRHVLSVASLLSFCLSFILYFSWKILDTRAPTPSSLVLVGWSLSVVIQVLCSRIYYKFVALNSYTINLAMTSVQFASFGILALALESVDFSVVLLVLIPNSCFVICYLIYLYKNRVIKRAKFNQNF